MQIPGRSAAYLQLSDTFAADCTDDLSLLCPFVTSWLFHEHLYLLSMAEQDGGEKEDEEEGRKEGGGGLPSPGRALMKSL